MINTFVGTVYSICSLARMKFLTFPLNFISFSNLTSEIIRVVLNDRLVATLNLRSSKAKSEPPAGRYRIA